MACNGADTAAAGRWARQSQRTDAAANRARAAHAAALAPAFNAAGKIPRPLSQKREAARPSQRAEELQAALVETNRNIQRLEEATAGGTTTQNLSCPGALGGLNRRRRIRDDIQQHCRLACPAQQRDSKRRTTTCTSNGDMAKPSPGNLGHDRPPATRTRRHSAAGARSAGERRRARRRRTRTGRRAHPRSITSAWDAYFDASGPSTPRRLPTA